jgi:hypothetical protein
MLAELQVAPAWLKDQMTRLRIPPDHVGGFGVLGGVVRLSLVR